MPLILAAALALLSGCSRAPEPPAPAPAETESPPETARSRRDVFLFLGDSLTAGYGVAPEEAYPSLLAERWRREGVPFRPRNAGVSGQTTAGVLENLDWNLSPEVHTVFLAIGANDGLRGHDLAATRSNLSEIVRRIREKGSRVVLAGMKIPPNYGPDYSRRFEGLYGELSREHGVELMPFLLDGVAGLPAFNLPDGIHPNERGHARIAERVHKFLSSRGLLK